MNPSIITIQALLQGRNPDFDQAVAAQRVKFIRHADTREDIVIRNTTYKNKTLRELYMANPQLLLDYQAEQSKRLFLNADYVVTLLGEQGKLSRFIGVFRNNGYLSTQPYFVYDLVEAEGFEALKEKVVIDWGDAPANSKVHFYHTNIKEVVRIDGGLHDAHGIPIFRTYDDFILPYDTLKLIFDKQPAEWKSRLQSINCIYLITDRINGKHYVGCTHEGRQGMWHRWSEYAKNGHGGNKDLEAILKADPNRIHDFSWSILKQLPLNVTQREAQEWEEIYMDKILSRPFGYNN